MGSPPLLRLNGATDSLSGDAPAPEATTGASYNSRDNSMAYASAGGVAAQGWFYDSKREFTDGGDRDDRRGAQGSTLLRLTPNRSRCASPKATGWDSPDASHTSGRRAKSKTTWARGTETSLS